MSIPDPIVLLDARAKYVHPAFQMTRASTKTVFDAAGRMMTVPPNAIGWDHDPATGQARGYLAEPSATNLLLHSNDLTQSSWTAFGSTITGDAITGPDGQGMAKLVENNADQSHSVLQNFTIGDGDTIAAHVIVKAGEREGLRLAFRQNSSGSNIFYIQAYLTGDGSADAPVAAGSATAIDGGITHLGGGFYHVWLVGTLGAGITDARLNPGLLDGNGSTSYQGDGTSGLYVGYCQAEVGSYPTSYIETGASTVTRAGDSLVLSDLGDFPWWRSERGALLVDVDLPFAVRSGHVWSLNEQVTARFQSTADRVILYGSSVDGTGIIRNLGDQLGRYVIGVSWDESEAVAASDGAIKTTQSLTQAINATALGLGCQVNGSNRILGHIHRATYYPARISNADLQSLTAMQE